MTVEIYQGGDFQTSHERRAVDQLVESLNSKFGDCDDLYVVLADYSLGAKELDLTILKKDAILVVELKRESEPFRATENEWKTNTGRKVGGTSFSPFRQVRGYRNCWRDFMKKNGRSLRCLGALQRNDFDRATWHSKCVVAIDPVLPEGVINEINAPWFHLCGVEDLTRVAEIETAPFFNFSHDELRMIAKSWLGLDGPYERINIRKAVSDAPTPEDFHKVEGLLADIRRRTEELEHKKNDEKKSTSPEDYKRLESKLKEIRDRTEELEGLKHVQDDSTNTDLLRRIESLLTELHAKADNSNKSRVGDTNLSDKSASGVGDSPVGPGEETNNRRYAYSGMVVALVLGLVLYYFLRDDTDPAQGVSIPNPNTPAGFDQKVDVPPPPMPPVASFSTSISDLTVRFTDHSHDGDGRLVGWNWSLGDGSISTEQNPMHTYATEGAYSVILTVKDNDGQTSPPVDERVVVNRPLCDLGTCCDNPREWSEAKKFIGQHLAVSGPVREVTYGANVRNQPTWINVGEAYPNSQRLALVIWKRNLSQLEGEVEKCRGGGKAVCAIGDVKTYDGIVQIELRNANQLNCW